MYQSKSFRKEVHTFGKKSRSIKVAYLTKADYDKYPRIRPFFRVNNQTLDRFHIPEITAEEYAVIAKEFKDTPKFNKDNLRYDTASTYYIRKARVIKLANMLGIKPSEIDTKDYIWDERYYTCRNFWDNVEEVDEAFRTEGDDEREASAWDVYISEDWRQHTFDIKTYEELFKFCYKAIRVRKAMLLSKVEQCVSFLVSLAERTNGFSENVSGDVQATLTKYMTFFEDLLSNEEFKAYIANTNDIEVFGNDDLTRSDYIEAYRRMLKCLQRGGELMYFKAVLNAVEDPYLDCILDDDMHLDEITGVQYIIDGDSEEEPEDEDILD